MRSWTRLRILSLFAAIAVLVSACQVNIGVDIDVESDGGGVVTVRTELDPEAAQMLPTLAEQFRLEDLEAADWDISEFEEFDVDDEVWMEIEAKKRAAAGLPAEGTNESSLWKIVSGVLFVLLLASLVIRKGPVSPDELYDSESNPEAH